MAILHRGLLVGVIILSCGFLGGCQSASGVFDVRNFGAKGDGTTLDTVAVNRAINAAAGAGGGSVHFGPGTYLCYSIHLQSNIALDLDNGATILAAGTAVDGQYDPPEPNISDHYQDFGHTHWHNSLIWGEGLANVSIVGMGKIYGRGLSTGHLPKSTTQPADPSAPPPTPYDDTADNLVDIAATQPATRPTTEPSYPNATDTLASGLGNKAIALKNCYNVTIRDVSIFEGGHFAILATAVDGLTIDNVKIDTNRDGIDIDCCRNVRVSNCSVNSPWDDALVLKTTLALGYPRDTQDVTITNCLVSGGYREGTLLDGTFEHIGKDYNFGHRVPRTGRIKFGTESNGGFRNIAISNCVLDNCQGLAIESVDGGVIENVGVSNITMRDIVSPPIFIRLGGRLRAPEGTAVGAIRHINISDIVGTVAASHYACIISGVPGHDIEDVRVRNVNLIFPGGGTAKLAATRPAEKEKNYPEATMFGGMPAWGFFIRHVRNIALSDVDVACLKEDARPPFFLTDVQGADFQNVRTPGYSGDAPIFALQSVQDFNARQMRGMPDTYRDWVEEGGIGAGAGKQ